MPSKFSDFFSSRKSDIELPNESGRKDPRLPKKKKGIMDKYNPFKVYGNAIDESLENSKSKKK